MPKRIVILGAGFGGMNVARNLEKMAHPGEVAVTVVNRDNYMLFTPMLPEVSSGSIEPRHITPPLRAVLRRTGFELGEVTEVDFATSVVRVRRSFAQDETTLPYDQLVVAFGSENSTHGVPGADKHTLPFKTIRDADGVRDATIGALENAASCPDERERRTLTTFAVIGGGFTGVESAGELLAFIRSALRFYPTIKKDDVRVLLIAGGARLLEQLSVAAGDAANRMLSKRGVEIVLNDEVAAIDAGGVTLASGKRFDTRCVIWSAGVRPAPLLEHLDLQLSKHHAVAVGPDLCALGRDNVWALGDCAQIPAPNGEFYPQTAQHALTESRTLAQNVLARLRGRPTKPYVYRSRGMMASLGDRQGLADLGGRFVVPGLLGWLVWRAFYLSALPGRDRKTRVLLDWSLGLRFPEDIASVR